MRSKTFQDDYKETTKGIHPFSEGGLANVQNHEAQGNLLHVPTTGIKQGLEWYRLKEGLWFHHTRLFSQQTPSEARQQRDSNGTGSPTTPRVSQSDLP